MSKKRDAFGRLHDHSLVEFAELIWKRGLLDTLVKRAPAFSNIRLGWYMHMPTVSGRPAKEISPGAGPLGGLTVLRCKCRMRFSSVIVCG
jgi:hypothetical protein